MGHRVCLAARKRELMLRALGDVVVVVPPLSIAPAEVDLLIEALHASIKDATEA